MGFTFDFFLNPEYTEKTILEKIEYCEWFLGGGFLEGDFEFDTQDFKSLEREIHSLRFEYYINTEINALNRFISDNTITNDLKLNAINETTIKIKQLIYRKELAGFYFFEKSKTDNVIAFLDKLKELYNEANSNSKIDLSSKYSELDLEIPISISEKLKFAMASELGVINHLQKYLTDRNFKMNDNKVYPLLSLITGISESTIKRMFPFHKDKTIKDFKRNPWKIHEIETYLERFNFYLSQGEIYNNPSK